MFLTKIKIIANYAFTLNKCVDLRHNYITITMNDRIYNYADVGYT